MNIKSLLLGSAAALVAASGARAADAVVVAEPEPVEYVRVCDVYGTGFYYMPGTETCLKVSGYMRYDIGGGDLFGNQSVDKKELLESGVVDINDTYYKRARFALRLDARTETELGTLRAYTQINFQFDADQGSELVDLDGDGDLDTNIPFVETNTETALNHAYLELGGFLIGKTDSLFTTFTDYAGTVINDDFAVPFGPYDTHTIQYKYDAGNGFTAAIAVEEGTGDDDVFINVDGIDVAVSPDIYTLDDWVPHVVAGVGYTGGWGGIRLVGAYDAVWEQFAVKAKLDIKATEALSLFVMAGWKDSDDFTFDTDVNGDGVIETTTISNLNYYGNWGGDWAVWGGGRWVVTEKAAINVQLAYDDFENFSAVANVDYELVPGFTITPELAYADNFDDENEVIFGNGDEEGEFGAFLRFQRNF